MTSVTNPATAATSATKATTTGSSAAGVSADYNMFLKLLTTQMQNQDPLNPTDSTQYTQQLAQYSQVEQTIQQTETLKNILASFSTQNMAQASAYIGREAQFSSAISGLAGSSPARWNYTGDRSLISLVATISDASGKQIDTRTISAYGATGHFSWNGQLANGTTAPDGAYTLALKGVDANGASVPVSVASVGVVQNVVTSNGGLSLGINGIPLPANALVQVASAG